MKRMLVLLAFMMVSLIAFAQSAISPEKRQEIEKMMRLTGSEKLVEQAIDQLIAGMEKADPDMPKEFWERFRQKIDFKQLVAKYIPLYDKYYTLEDLKAINAFYESPAGRKVLSVTPLLMRDGMNIGMEWGREIGHQLNKEIEQEQLGRKTAQELLEMNKQELKEKKKSDKSDKETPQAK